MKNSVEDANCHLAGLELWTRGSGLSAANLQTLQSKVIKQDNVMILGGVRNRAEIKAENRDGLQGPQW